jgi:hypothetical protein
LLRLVRVAFLAGPEHLQSLDGLNGHRDRLRIIEALTAHLRTCSVPLTSGPSLLASA